MSRLPCSLALLLFLAGRSEVEGQDQRSEVRDHRSEGGAPSTNPVIHQSINPQATEAEKSKGENQNSKTENWRPLFDGHSLTGWDEAAFGGRGEVVCVSNRIRLSAGDPFTGLNYTNPVPKMNYEVALEAMRVAGSDFFCGLTVPVDDSFCSLIVGGWGGALVGISSLDGMDASENETTKWINFEQGRWYRIRLRVTQRRLEAWLDQDKIIDVVTTGRQISLRPGEIELSKPFGIASYQTTAALRDIKLRTVTGPAGPVKKGAVGEQ